MDQQELILKNLSTLSGKSTNLGVVDDYNYSTERMGSSVLEYVTSKLNPATQPEEKYRLQSHIIQAIRKGLENDTSAGSSPLSLSVSGVVRADSSNTLLSSLTYANMADREWRVAEAHRGTFRWLFDENEEARKSDFKDWLSSKEKLYWITGKAGSGKSTLMKYISHPDESPDRPNPRALCSEDLSKWSGDSRLVIASFYFWTSGMRMQTTQRGMMMTLLHQILKQCPDLAPVVCPARWEMLCLFGNYAKEWDEGELRNTLYYAIRTSQSYDTKIALFIDGLDEFEGTSEELIQFLHDILPLPNLKLCVSSRPWMEFEDASRHKPSLRLEDLTYNDITKFVASKFDAEPLFQDLRDQEGQYSAMLIESIVTKAQGVFSWVALVVSSLIAGLSSGDRVSDLEKRLAVLPPDLEGLYQRILRSLDPFYLEHAAQLFALVAAYQGPLNVVIALFADEEAPNFCLTRSVQQMSEVENLRCIDTMRRRINTRTRGLLEVKRPNYADDSQTLNPEYHTIQYLHRTVKDYVESETAQRVFRPAMASSFDPHLRLLAGQVTYMKTFNTDIHPMQEIVMFIFRCMGLAREVAAGNISTMVILLDELDKVVSALWKRIAIVTKKARATREKGLWTLEICPASELGTWEEQWFGHTFLSLAVALNVVEYVRAKAPPACLVKRPYLNMENSTITYKKWPLLMDIIYVGTPFTLWGENLENRNFICFAPNPEDLSGSANVRMLECLLAKGADPAFNANLAGNTSLLVEMTAQMMRNQTQSMTEAIRLLIRDIEIDETMLIKILYRFRRRALRIGMRYDGYSSGELRRRTSSGTSSGTSYGILEEYLVEGEGIYIRPRALKKVTQHLRLALENLRDVNKSGDAIDYAKVISIAPEFSVAQALVSPYLTVLLTSGAKRQSLIRALPKFR